MLGNQLGKPSGATASRLYMVHGKPQTRSFHGQTVI